MNVVLPRRNTYASRDGVGGDFKDFGDARPDFQRFLDVPFLILLKAASDSLVMPAMAVERLWDKRNLANTQNHCVKEPVPGELELHEFAADVQWNRRSTENDGTCIWNGVFLKKRPLDFFRACDYV